MAVKVTIVSPIKNRITINKQDKRDIRTIGVAPPASAIDRLTELVDVDSSDADDGETVVYDEASGKYVVEVLPKLDGGTF